MSGAQDPDSTMTTGAFRAIRERLGLSTAQLAFVLQVDPRTVRRFEDGTRPISGPVQVLMTSLSTGQLPLLPAPQRRGKLLP